MHYLAMFLHMNVNCHIELSFFLLGKMQNALSLERHINISEALFIAT